MPAGRIEPNWDYLRFLLDILAERWRVPGLVMAVGSDHGLLFEHARGLADIEVGQPMSVDHAFRIGSLSKVITAAAIWRLVGQGDLTLDATLGDVFPVMRSMTLKNPAVADLTVRNLMQMRVRFAEVGDPFTQFAMMRRRIGRRERLPIDYVLQCLSQESLPQRQGTEWVWGLFAYTVLGRIIERCSGQAYEDFVRDQLILPAGVPDIVIGAAQREFRLPYEATYYTDDRAVGRGVPALGLTMEVPLPYCEQVVQLRDSNGGWIARPRDLVRLLTRLYHPHGDILGAEERLGIEEAPAQVRDVRNYFGCGWWIKRDTVFKEEVPARGHRWDWSAAGGLTGTTNYLGRRRDGLTWVISMNLSADEERARQYRTLGVLTWSFFNGDMDGCEAALRGAE